MEIIRANIVTYPVDVIVNSAHPTLMAGSGVCGAIHSAAGPELEVAARSLGPLNPGQAVTTPGFSLSAQFVIHAVAPRYLHGTEDEESLLAETYSSALDEFSKLDGLRSLAFPSMGTGIYGWPLETAAKIAIEALKNSRVERLVICAFDAETESAYKSALLASTA